MVKILIIEDDPLMSRMYQKVFTLQGFGVDLASDGEQGLAQAQKGLPTLILLDVMMPKMNGLQVLEQLKADPLTKAIPVIMITNLAGEQDAEAAINKGALKYIIKSEFDPDKLVLIVKGILLGNVPNIP